MNKNDTIDVLQVSKNNKKIAKNTLFLYFRMIFVMLISLFTTRIVLETLGIVDYGIYNVVGGVVVMFSFLSSSLASASQRFFAFELGQKNMRQLKNTFNVTVSIYFLLAIIVLIVSETIGLWFLNNRLTIPSDRIVAANWVFQFSILSFIITLLTIPYNAAIIAHERMNIYAYVSLVEVCLKLVIVYLLFLFDYDKLKLYGFLTLLVVLVVSFIYLVYCRKQFEECKYRFYWDKILFKKMLSYSGWNLFGSMAGVLNGQGINVILNIFFGPVVNAARGLAYTVSGAANQFVGGFMAATRPQIVKYYAQGSKDLMLNLVFQSSKLSFFLLLLISMPILLEAEFIFSLWLKEVPAYVVLFTRLVIVLILVESISNPLMTAAQATGKIERYQAIVGTTMMLNLPVSYVFLKFNFPPETVMYIAIINSIICLFIRLILLEKMVDLPFNLFLKKVIFVIFIVSFTSYILPTLLRLYLETNLVRFFVVGFFSVVSTLLTIYFLGLDTKEKGFVRKKIDDLLIKAK